MAEANLKKFIVFILLILYAKLSLSFQSQLCKERAHSETK